MNLANFAFSKIIHRVGAFVGKISKQSTGVVEFHETEVPWELGEKRDIEITIKLRGVMAVQSEFREGVNKITFIADETVVEIKE
jgi:hypothetical protein